jgi:hypothetical protein
MTADTTAPTAGDTFPGRPARPGGAAYWALVKKHADAAPPLSIEQRAAIRLAIWGCRSARTETAA